MTAQQSLITASAGFFQKFRGLREAIPALFCRVLVKAVETCSLTYDQHGLGGIAEHCGSIRIADLPVSPADSHSHGETGPALRVV